MQKVPKHCHPPVAHLSSFKTQIQVACWSNIWSKQAHHQRICTFFGTAGGFSFSQAVVFALRGVVLEQQSLPFTAIHRPSYQVQGWSPGALGCLLLHNTFTLEHAWLVHATKLQSPTLYQKLPSVFTIKQNVVHQLQSLTLPLLVEVVALPP